MLSAAFILLTQLPGDETAPRDLAALLRKAPQACSAILDRPREHRLQILLAEPVRRADGLVTLRRSSLGDPQQYFYPASAIKLCGAVAALQKLNAHNQEHGTELGLTTALSIEPRFAGDQRVAEDATNLTGGHLTLEHALRKLFLVSDNAAFNHCFELCGQDGVNQAMWQAGLGSVRIWHRLSESRSLAEHRQTRAVEWSGPFGKLTWPGRDAGIPLSNNSWQELEIGEGYIHNGARVSRPMSFAEKNAILLTDLQDLLIAVLRPEIVTGKRGFPDLTLAQRRLLTQLLGELPSESTNPKYDPKEIPDHHCKFILRGVARVLPAQHLRVYDKIGRAYGFSIENAYVEDQRSGRGFFLAIVLYTNPDGILNDDAYAYQELADPFLDAAGELLTRAVLSR